MSRASRAAMGWWFGCAVFVAGVLVGFGPAWALIAAGVVIAASFLLLYDVDGPEQPDPEEARFR